MICHYDHLRRYRMVFLKITGLRQPKFADLLDDMLPRFAAAEQTRLRRSNRRRVSALAPDDNSNKQHSDRATE